jgi:NAD(P)-dependent dehydrogenase (short-subunit alcohol dehydrogenase family)
MNLTGKIVAVTGGFGILGAAVVQAVQAAGAKVAAIDRVAAGKAPATISNALLMGEVDLDSAAAAQAALKTIADTLGGLDGLVNIAGGFRWETLEGGSIDTWDLLYKINVRTAVNASKAALPYLQQRGAGRIVNIGANAAAKAAAGMGAYTASKASVAKLTEAMADELKDRAITVNALLPSILDTPQNRADMPDADFSRWVQPAALADVVVFLLSGHAAAITGASIPVTGRV